MAGVYDDDIATALEMIAEFGEDAVLKVLTTTGGANDWDVGAPTEQTVTARMVFLNFKGNSNGETYWNGQLVQQGDKKVLLAGAVSLAPNLHALITRADGSVWKVMNLTRLDPNGQQILYTMQARQ